MNPHHKPRAAIACGGTGGHLFPGAAAAAALRARGWETTLLISEKAVDQRAIAGLKPGFDIVSLPAVGFSRNRFPQFLWSLARAYAAARIEFRRRPPDAVLAMGGFTSAPAALAARRAGAAALLHESNVIPGRANRWLARWVDEALVGFAAAAPRLRARAFALTGTPVREGIGTPRPGDARRRLGLDPDRPVLLFAGGSQGATALNRVAPAVTREALKVCPDLQWAHLAGPRDFEAVRRAAAASGAPFRVDPFTDEMQDWLAAASVAISRAGAGSLAEFAAARLPAILVPYPAAADNHQWHNARAFVDAGAAEICLETDLDPSGLAAGVARIIADQSIRERMRAALAGRHTPDAAEAIADRVAAAARRHTRRPAWPATVRPANQTPSR